MKTISTLLFAACLMITAALPTLAGDGPAALARLYGLDGWDQIEELHYTFNVRSGGREVQRSWVWRVTERTVTFRDELSEAEPVTYSLDDINETTGDDLKKVDHRFINDQYWLLFALHVAWDKDAAVTETAGQPLPIGEGTATRITVQYPETGGYTPGDAYDVYVGEDGYVTHWVFRQGGQAEPSLATTWENHQKAGPIVVPTRFKSGDDGFELWFSDVSVKLTGSEKSLKAE
jgi:hypothetical protein